MTVETVQAFLLSRSWRDTPRGLHLELWATAGDAAVHVQLTREKAVMFVNRDAESQAVERRSVALTNLSGGAVDALYFESQRELQQERLRLNGLGLFPHEADIKPCERFLMERFVTGGLKITGAAKRELSPSGKVVLRFVNPKIEALDVTPNFRVLSLDIETDDLNGPLLCLAGATTTQRRVFMVGTGDPIEHGVYYASPRELLTAFYTWLEEIDPDVLIGWNVVDYDLRYLAALSKQLGLPFRLGRGGAVAEIFEPQARKTSQTSWWRRSQANSARVPGRVVLDGIATLRSASFTLESFALEDVAQRLLGRGKVIAKTQDPVAEIRRLFAQDKPALARYNLADCQLVLEIFEKARLGDFVVERQRLTGLPLDRQGGSVAAFDQLYLPRLHRAGRVAPSTDAGAEFAPSPGGYVLESKPGLYKNVLVLDFKSLYPSIIRTFNIDPLGLAFPGENPIPGFEGASFSRDTHILPGLIGTLWEARDRAKQEQNAALSQAIKILMNSFYGVLGTPGCRFFNQQLVSSITRRGHAILKETQEFIEARGLVVIYGDTDSLFVQLDAELEPATCQHVGRQLADALNAHWQALLRRRYALDSFLEVEFETHYLRFLMPTLRGSERGTKKRYAGSTLGRDGEVRISFKGLEAVRTDWTPLARGFQRELYRRVFQDEPYADFVLTTTRELLAGKLDQQLVYKKRLRRELTAYTKNVPPHVQAARKTGADDASIEYVITTSGPEPARTRRSCLDYEHYVDRQLAPVADGILPFLGTSFSEITGGQLRLF